MVILRCFGAATARGCCATATLAAMFLATFLLLGNTPQGVLERLEGAEGGPVALALTVLFLIVSFPVCVGYIALVVATGYLFGIWRGLPLVVFAANLGVLVAHNSMPRLLVCGGAAARRLTHAQLAKAMVHVISGPMAFRIVLFTRLTPVPFGLQNAIFALTNVPVRSYHVASLVGLLPAQIVGVYVGSTLHSMQDVVESHRVSAASFFVVALQLTASAALLFFFGRKARDELLSALANAENRDSAPYNVV